MTSWIDGPMLGFDLETTSADPETARIVQFALVCRDPNDPDWERTIVETVDPGVPIPPEATAIHGFADEDVTEAMSHTTAVLYVAGFLHGAAMKGIPVVGMNLSYDLTIIDRGLIDTQLDVRLRDTLGPVLDLLVIDRHVDKYRKGKRNLGALARHYGVDDFGAHDAGADALAAIEAVRGLARTYPTVAAMTLDQLTARQSVWHREWAIGFDRYLRDRRRPGLDMPRAGEWPLTSLPGRRPMAPIPPATMDDVEP